MLLYWIILTIQIIILVVSIVVYVNKKQWFALFILIADICSITLTYRALKCPICRRMSLRIFTPVRRLMICISER